MPAPAPVRSSTTFPTLPSPPPSPASALPSSSLPSPHSSLAPPPPAHTLPANPRRHTTSAYAAHFDPARPRRSSPLAGPSLALARDGTLAPARPSPLAASYSFAASDTGGAGRTEGRRGLRPASWYAPLLPGPGAGAGTKAGPGKDKDKENGKSAVREKEKEKEKEKEEEKKEEKEKSTRRRSMRFSLGTVRPRTAPAPSSTTMTGAGQGHGDVPTLPTPAQVRRPATAAASSGPDSSRAFLSVPSTPSGRRNSVLAASANATFSSTASNAANPSMPASSSKLPARISTSASSSSTSTATSASTSTPANPRARPHTSRSATLPARTSFLPPAAAEAHWLTMAPGDGPPRFSRRGLRAQGVVMPVSAKEARRRSMASVSGEPGGGGKKVVEEKGKEKERAGAIAGVGGGSGVARERAGSEPGARGEAALHAPVVSPTAVATSAVEPQRKVGRAPTAGSHPATPPAEQPGAPVRTPDSPHGGSSKMLPALLTSLRAWARPAKHTTAKSVRTPTSSTAPTPLASAAASPYASAVPTPLASALPSPAASTASLPLARAPPPSVRSTASAPRAPSLTRSTSAASVVSASVAEQEQQPASEFGELCPAGGGEGKSVVVEVRVNGVPVEMGAEDEELGIEMTPPPSPPAAVYVAPARGRERALMPGPADADAKPKSGFEMLRGVRVELRDAEVEAVPVLPEVRRKLVRSKTGKEKGAMKEKTRGWRGVVKSLSVRAR